MGVLNRNCRLAPLGVVLAILVLSGARAGAILNDISGTSSDKPGSLISFPKIIADGTRDTIVLLTNTSNTPRFAHCLYLSGEGFCTVSQELCNPVPRANVRGQFGPGDCPDPVPGEQCLPFWQELDFDVTLTKQQPTMWRVSTGRFPDLNGDAYDTSCVNDEELFPGPPPVIVTTQNCPGFGPGQILPPVQPFRGQLWCYETDTIDGPPMGGNSLKGEAIIQSLSSLQVSKYNSINFEADSEELNADFLLRLNNGEYNACPQSNEVNHFAQFATDYTAVGIDSELCDDLGFCVGGGATGEPCDVGMPCGNGTGRCNGCPVRTELTLIPCSTDIEQQQPIPAPVEIKCVDQMELESSVSFVVDCWTNLDFGIAPFAQCADPTRSDFYKTRVIPSSGLVCLSGTGLGNACDDDADCGVGGTCGPQPGILAVVEEFYETDESIGAAIIDPNFALAGSAASNAVMIGVRTGVCRNHTFDTCTEPRPGCDCLIDQLNLPPTN